MATLNLQQYLTLTVELVQNRRGSDKTTLVSQDVCPVCPVLGCPAVYISYWHTNVLVKIAVIKVINQYLQQDCHY